MSEALVAGRAEGVDLLVGARGLAEALAETMTGRAASEAATIRSGNGLLSSGREIRSPSGRLKS